MRKTLAMLTLLYFAIPGVGFAGPKEQLLEEALLQRLHDVIQSSVASIYQEQYAQYHSERIVSIQEQVTVSPEKKSCSGGCFTWAALF
ncbi:hypothetical protein LJK88_41505 [Paenibacillus sp. P26]|nr:hypothetical protein LJK88_41505 [Paenibacillus sp. P26]UUZ92728.1 hypothetical protein LJK87_46805 [Paenibacillus sp. P25]